MLADEFRTDPKTMDLDALLDQVQLCSIRWWNSRGPSGSERCNKEDYEQRIAVLRHEVKTRVADKSRSEEQ